jgi:hypothetical protein
MLRYLPGCSRRTNAGARSPYSWHFGPPQRLATRTLLLISAPTLVLTSYRRVDGRSLIARDHSDWRERACAFRCPRAWFMGA